MNLKHKLIRLCTTHWLNGDPELLDPDELARKSTAGAAAFLSKFIGGECSHVVIAYDDGLIGFFRFTIVDSNGYNLLLAQGTYVSVEYRKEGLAALLWSTAIERLGVHEVEANAVSLGGKKMVKAMKRKYRNVEFGPIY